MAALHRLPYNPGLLIIEMDHRLFFPVIGNPLTDLAVFLDHQHAFHIRNLSRDRIGITDVTHGLHTLRRHLLRLAEPLIENPQGFRNMPFQKLIPGKYYHLFPVAQAQIPRLFLIGYQIRI